MLPRGSLLALVALWAMPSVAQAHSAIKGIGTFYNGILHPLFVPAHVLVILALGLFMAQQGTKTSQRTLAVAVVSALSGLVITFFVPTEILQPYILALAALLGVLAAISKGWPLWLGVLLAVIVGGIVGLDSAQTEQLGREKLTSMLGTGVGISLLMLYFTALAHMLSKKEWQKIGIRVLGSWIAASSLMVLALSFAPATA